MASVSDIKKLPIRKISDDLTDDEAAALIRFCLDGLLQSVLNIQAVINGDTTGLDHGTLSGLFDDDHPQYLLLSGRIPGDIIYQADSATPGTRWRANSSGTADIFQWQDSTAAVLGGVTHGGDIHGGAYPGTSNLRLSSDSTTGASGHTAYIDLLSTPSISIGMVNSSGVDKVNWTIGLSGNPGGTLAGLGGSIDLTSNSSSNSEITIDNSSGTAGNVPFTIKRRTTGQTANLFNFIDPTTPLVPLTYFDKDGIYHGPVTLSGASSLAASLYVTSGVVEVDAALWSSGTTVSSGAAPPGSGTALVNVQAGWMLSGPGVTAGTYVVSHDSDCQVTVSVAPSPAFSNTTGYFSRGILMQGSATGNPMGVLSLPTVAEKAVAATFNNPLSLTLITAATLQNSNVFTRKLSITNSTDAISLDVSGSPTGSLLKLSGGAGADPDEYLFIDTGVSTPNQVMRVRAGGVDVASLDTVGIWTENFPYWYDSGTTDTLQHLHGAFTALRSASWADASGTPVLWTAGNAMPAAGAILYGVGPTTAMTSLAIGASGTVLTSTGSAPQWSTNAAVVDVARTWSTLQKFPDDKFQIIGSATATKIAQFEVDGLTVGTNTYTLPDAAGAGLTLAALQKVQTFTVAQTVAIALNDSDVVPLTVKGAVEVVPGAVNANLLDLYAGASRAFSVRRNGTISDGDFAISKAADRTLFFLFSATNVSATRTFTVANASGMPLISSVTTGLPAAGSLVYGAGTTTGMTALTIGAADTILTSTGSAPQWSTNAAVVDVARTWATLQTFKDTTFKVVDDADASKTLVFSLGGATANADLTLDYRSAVDRSLIWNLSGGTGGNLTLTWAGTADKTITIPAVTDTLAVLGTAQTFTAAQTMAATGAVSFTVQPPVDADTTDILRVYARDTGNLGVMVDYTAGGINVAGIGFWPSANIGVGNVGSFVSAALSTGRTWTMPNATGTVTVIASANLISTRVPFLSGTTGLMTTSAGMTYATGTGLSLLQATLGNSVTVLSSTATNDDPTEIVYQNRAATTDATVTTLHTFTIPASTTYTIDAVVVARRTGGAAGTAEDGAAYKIFAAIKNVAGTATIISTVQASETVEDQSGWDATIDVTGATARLRVTGAANNNVTWHMTARVWSVGT